MENQKSNSASTPLSGKRSSQNSQNASIPTSQLMELFENELKDIYWAENALTKAIPKMIDNVTSGELIEALTNHLTETKNQITRLEKVFQLIDKKATGKKCEAMVGLIKEAEDIMDTCEEGAMCDAGIIAAAQKVEHYEIATYGTLRQFAETLGLTQAATLLEDTLNEEKEADEILSDVAHSINIEAAEGNSNNNSTL